MVQKAEADQEIIKRKLYDASKRLDERRQKLAEALDKESKLDGLKPRLCRVLEDHAVGLPDSLTPAIFIQRLIYEDFDSAEMLGEVTPSTLQTIFPEIRVGCSQRLCKLFVRELIE